MFLAGKKSLLFGNLYRVGFLFSAECTVLLLMIYERITLTAGSCNVTMFLCPTASFEKRRIPVNIYCHAATNEQEKTLKLFTKASILLIHFIQLLLCLSFCLLKLSVPTFSKVVAQSFPQVGAGVNGKCSVLPHLLFATEGGGYTDLVRLLLTVRADPNTLDDVCVFHIF